MIMMMMTRVTYLLRVSLVKSGRASTHRKLGAKLKTRNSPLLEMARRIAYSAVVRNLSANWSSEIEVVFVKETQL